MTKELEALVKAVEEAREHCPAHFKHVSWFKKLGIVLDNVKGFDKPS